MSMRYGPVTLNVPPGFQNILHLISQEVLRTKPKNTYEFIAGFMDDLLAIREESGYDPVTQSDMINRVQEQYWRIQRERNNSNVKDEDLKTMQTSVGSGDKGLSNVSDNAEALVTMVIHQENNNSTQQRDDRKTEELSPVAKQTSADPEVDDEVEDAVMNDTGGSDSHLNKEADGD